MICANCHKSNADSARFCGSCGQRLQGADAGAQPAPAAAYPGAGTAGVASAAAGAWCASTPTTAAPGLLERIKNILLNPKQEWLRIESEPTSIGQLYSGYVMPMAAFAALMSFVRLSLIGVSLPFGGAVRTPIVSGLIYALVAFGFALLGLFVIGLIINGLAPTFSGTRDQGQALKTAAYALTPAWLSTVLSLLPLSTLLQLLAGLYGIYLLYLGLPLLMSAPREKAFGYTATVVICTILLGIVFGVLSAATGAFGHLAVGGGGLLGSQSPAAIQDQGATAAGNIIGGALGTDAQGRAALGNALANLAKAGQQSQPPPSTSGQPANAAHPSGSDDTQNVASATAGLLTALGGALGGSHRVDPVDFQNLKAMLPQELPGLQRSGTEGSNQQALGVKSSSATAEYQGAGVHVQIKLADISGVSGLIGVAAALPQTTDSASDTGYEKDATIGGRVVHERYDGKARHGELSVILVKRFEVDVTGDGVDMAGLETDLGRVDLARLEAMKDVGAQAR